MVSCSLSVNPLSRLQFRVYWEEARDHGLDKEQDWHPTLRLNLAP